MIFTETKLKGSYIIDVERLEDERGFFARSWCQREFAEHGLNPRLVQCNISFNSKNGTLRGMHYQIKPFEEAKLIRCTRGAIYDVIVDIRPDSPTYCQWIAVVLSAHCSQPSAHRSLLTADNRRMLYVPEGFANGFLTLDDNSEVFYQMSEFYSPDHARGFRWNDAAFRIKWLGEVKVISERDETYPDFSF
jgi:dTDP-4-dehydrorhamnose 3,5-epimerase